MKLFFNIFFIIGLCLLGSSMYTGVKIIQAQDWVSVRGSIEDIRLIKSRDRSTVSEKIIYAYVVNNKEYKNTTDYFGLIVGSDERQSAYKVGSQVKVYYNPDDPMDSALRPTYTRSLIFCLFASFLFMGFSIIGHKRLNKKASQGN